MDVSHTKSVKLLARLMCGKKEQNVTFTTIKKYLNVRGGNTSTRKVLIVNNGMATAKSILSMSQWAHMELVDE